MPNPGTDPELNLGLLLPTPAVDAAAVGEIVPGRCSGERLPDVISFRFVTAIGTLRRRSVGETKEIRRLSLAGDRCAGRTEGWPEPRPPKAEAEL